MVAEDLSDPFLVARMDAMLALDEAERATTRVVGQTLTAWLRVASAEVLGSARSLAAAGTPPDPEGITRAEAALRAAIARYLSPHLRHSFDRAFGRVLRGADIAAQPYREAFIAQAVQRITDLGPDTYARIRAVVGEGIGHGFSIEAISRGVRQALTVNGASPTWTMFAAAASERGGAIENELKALRLVPAHQRDAAWKVRLDQAMGLRQAARQDFASATDKVREEGLFPQHRLERIARTETMAAVNGGTLAGMGVRAGLTGEVVEKVWLATHDRRTRQDHRAADGQRVAHDAPFLVGGERLAFPGDPNGPARQVVNCRCTLLDVLAGEQLLPLVTL